MLVFFDDILIYSKTWEENSQHVGHQLYAKPSKCDFGLKEVNYLGHIVSHEGVKVDPNKIKTIMEWPIPKTIKKMRGFLGLTGYYRRFVKNYGHIVAPHTTLLKKDYFHWNESANVAFEQLKKTGYTTLVLATLNFTKEFIVECDASGNVIGAVLMQES